MNPPLRSESDRAALVEVVADGTVDMIATHDAPHAYSVRRRARWRRAGILTDARPLAEISPAAGDRTPDWPALRALRQRWAELLKRIFEVDPLRCPP
jgi:hypothetical protein